jgi:hypothetical protein
MSNSSECELTTAVETQQYPARDLVVDLMNGVALETSYLGGELATLGEDLCQPAESTSQSDRIVWMQSFDRLEQAARAQARFSKWLADCLAMDHSPGVPEIQAALEIIPLRDMKERLARIAGLSINEPCAGDADDEDIWSDPLVDRGQVRHG